MVQYFHLSETSKGPTEQEPSTEQEPPAGQEPQTLEDLKSCIEQELEYLDCESQQETIQEIDKNYRELSGLVQKPLLQRIAWKTKFIK